MFKMKNSAEKKAEQQRAIIKAAGKKKEILDRMEKSGVLAFDEAQRRLFISSRLASIYLQNGTAWGAFLTNVHQWIILKEQERAWNDYFREVEIAAVREAKKKYAYLSQADIRRIRQDARWKVDINAVAAPEVKPFEFFIADIMQNPEESEIVAVGIFDGKNFEMEKYSELRSRIVKA